ncbi:MAG TPA: hypothetical protein VK563_22945 [Puia sp.]|nr:hypothetical protein [Puia sp.]
MKKYLALLCFVIGMEGIVSAQTTDTTTSSPAAADTRKIGSPAKRAARQLTNLQEKLSLEPAQVQQMNLILLNQATAMDSLNANRSGNEKADRRSKRKLFMNTDQQIRAVLNDDQKKKYQQWKEEQKEQRAGKGRRNAAGPAQE